MITTDITTLKINKLTKAQYEAAIAAGTVNENELYMTESQDDSATEIFATTDYVDSKVSGLIDSAPETLDTLNELAAALGDDPNFATTIATQIGNKADKTAVDNLSTLVGDTSVSTQISNAVSAKADASDLTSHTSDTTLHTTADEKTKIANSIDLDSAAKLFTYKGYIRNEQELETSVTNPSIGDSYSLEDTTVKYWNGSSWVSAPMDVVFSNIMLAPSGFLTFPNTGDGGVCIHEESTSDTEPVLAFYGAAGDETVSLSNVKVPYLDTQINNIYGAKIKKWEATD